MVTRETLSRYLSDAGIVAGGDQIDQLLDLERLLRTDGMAGGLVGPNEAPHILERHVLDSAVLVTVIDARPDGRAIDVGSGAGLPGLVLAIVTDLRFTLLDAEARRTDFLARAAGRIGVRVDVVHARAEDAGRDRRLRDGFDVALARACAPPPVALELTLPFVRPGGRAVLAVGPSARDVLSASAQAAKVLAGGSPRLVPLQVPGLEAERWAMVVEKLEQTPDRYPRRAGVPSRRPLGT